MSGVTVSINNIVILGRLIMLVLINVFSERLEREIREKMEERAKDYAMKMRETLTSRKPAWRALRHTARYK